MPGCVQNLFGEVQAVGADIVFPPLAPGAHTARLQDRPGFAVLAGGLQSHVALRVSVKHSEKVVVGPGHDDTAEERRAVRLVAGQEGGEIPHTPMWEGCQHDVCINASIGDICRWKMLTLQGHNEEERGPCPPAHNLPGLQL